MTATQHATAPATQVANKDITLQDTERRTHRFSFQETKSSLKTTELYVFLAAVVGVLTASYLVGDNDSGNGDYFAADKAWLFIVILSVGYLVGRGLAKSGSRTDADA